MSFTSDLKHKGVEKVWDHTDNVGFFPHLNLFLLLLLF